MYTVLIWIFNFRYAKRFDCGIIYNLRVFLLDSKKEVIDEFSEEVEERLGDDDWHQVLYKEIEK